ncbi:Major Facilitator Superfamily protein [Pseudomonas chlororaphis]|uniref:MFS transporter n=1 Tax=Pseudomonas chlororaphis TaxID=587753 RepID=UPI00087AB398|nr:aromatic acid/H+ symport family MFS transporter [Pseudomonas chlororaphis]AZD64892.1 4-hydroxybenzoate transporter [Pseudomonas chlororaphis subsp. aurantiaca]QIT21061.1 aromatic acid/H+ symport family MFS transporter [Pseudomonas chlororaphis subsp. aurantiaca]WDH05209.1 aromatic acid/H+ symport family MFS transporter [Pseudomonas chlororaphis]WDH12036.1 aromatic acid/H+ symport family MFS transporter [Pseudomonas chlororaphis]SDT60182.1 Major Facilitator Superfamily protein [Pseudomonas c
MHNQIASFRAALDARPVSRYQWLLLLLLALLLVTDGYDAQVLGYVVPALAQDWGLEKAAFGPVFSANLLGLTLGSLAVTPLADRFGVRRILLACVLIYASLTVMMVFADSLNSLMVARFICGIGMGGAMPSAMALMSEYSPPRLRTLMVTLAACGFSFGGAAGGFVAAGFIDSFGWQAVFLAGGVTPSLLLESGLGLNEANLVTSMFLFAGTLGAICMAWFADRLKRKVRLLSAVLAGAALCTLLLGLNHDNPRYLVAFVFAAGFCIIGGQLTLNAFASNFYPAHVRATGTGWALGVGRFGSILGPLFGSLLLAMHIPVQQIFFFCAIPAVIAALLIIQVRSPSEASSAGAGPAPELQAPLKP